MWGINLYPAEYGSLDWVEFDSMINIRPLQQNRTRSVDDAAIKAQILEIVERMVVP